jgi:hypothetical protein
VIDGIVMVGGVTVGRVGAVLVGAVIAGVSGAVGSTVVEAGAASEAGGVALSADDAAAGVAAEGGSNWSGWPVESARAALAPKPNPISRAAVARPQSEELLRQAVIRDGNFHMLGGGRQGDAAKHHGGADDADNHESEEDGEESFHRLVPLSVVSERKRDREPGRRSAD